VGIEYRISCPPERLPELKEFLLRAGGRPWPEFPEQIQFRFRESVVEGRVEATAVIEADGLYFCDHCGAREPVAVLFQRIIDEALTLSGPSDSVVVTGL
jgi:hypothetical protein